MKLGSSPLLPPRVTRYPMDMSELELPDVRRWWTAKDYPQVGLFGAYFDSAANLIRAQGFWGQFAANDPQPRGFYLSPPVTLFSYIYSDNPVIRTAKAAVDNGPLGETERYFAVCACDSFAGSAYAIGLVREPLAYVSGENYRVGPSASSFTPTQRGAVTPFGLNEIKTHLLVGIPLDDRIRVERWLLVRDVDTQEVIELQSDGYTEWIHGSNTNTAFLRQTYQGWLEGVLLVYSGPENLLFGFQIFLDADGNILSGNTNQISVQTPYSGNFVHGWNPDDGTLVFTQEWHTYVGRIFSGQLHDPIDVEQPYDPRSNRYLWEPGEIKWLPLVGAGPQTLAQRYYLDKNQWAYFGMFAMSPATYLG